ncbi:MAG: hypothetical protein AAFP90_05840, partial [Planctomycetota bacterium]
FTQADNGTGNPKAETGKEQNAAGSDASAPQVNSVGSASTDEQPGLVLGIQQSIEPDLWLGDTGSIVLLRNGEMQRLIVVAPSVVQWKIAEFLHALQQ